MSDPTVVVVDQQPEPQPETEQTTSLAVGAALATAESATRMEILLAELREKNMELQTQQAAILQRLDEMQNRTEQAAGNVETAAAVLVVAAEAALEEAEPEEPASEAVLVESEEPVSEEIPEPPRHPVMTFLFGQK